MHTIWQQHYIRAILAMAVALALPWHCVVHCAPQMQPSHHTQFVCDMTQTTPTITANQHHITSATPHLSAVHVAIWVTGVFLAITILRQRYGLFIPVLVGISSPPTLHPPQHHFALSSF